MAQRTAQSAAEVADLVSDTTARIREGQEKTEASLVLMEEAVDSIQKVNAMVDEIDTAASGQLDAISRINDAVLDLDHATQKNVSFAARMAQTNQELEGLAESITETVQVFRIDSGRRERPDAVALRVKMKEEMALLASHA